MISCLPRSTDGRDQPNFCLKIQLSTQSPPSIGYMCSMYSLTFVNKDEHVGGARVCRAARVVPGVRHHRRFHLFGGKIQNTKWPNYLHIFLKVPCGSEGKTLILTSTATDFWIWMIIRVQAWKSWKSTFLLKIGLSFFKQDRLFWDFTLLASSEQIKILIKRIIFVNGRSNSDRNNIL